MLFGWVGNFSRQRRRRFGTGVMPQQQVTHNGLLVARKFGQQLQPACHLRGHGDTVAVQDARTRQRGDPAARQQGADP